MANRNLLALPAPPMTSARRILPLVLSAVLSAVPASAASYFYAIGSNNHLYEVSDAGIRRDIRDLSGLGAAGLVNGAAFDASNKKLFFSVPGSSPSAGELWYWDQATNGSPAYLGLLPTAKPDNASYWNGAYWYMEQGTTKLHRIEVQYSGGTPSLASGGASFATVNHSPALTDVNDRYFGDIAITTLSSSVATLYGATAYGNQFFSVSLSSGSLSGGLAATLLGTVGSTGVDKMQLSFDSAGTTLYGHAYDTGQWYTVNTTNGALTTLPSFITQTAGVSNGFQDMGGASATATPSVGVPDRGPWLALLSVTLVSLVLARRRG